MRKFSMLFAAAFIAVLLLGTATSFGQIEEAHKLSPVIPKLSSQARPSLVPIYAIGVIALLGVTAVVARSAHRGTRRGGRDETQQVIGR
jgi:hypothetical protein